MAGPNPEWQWGNSYPKDITSEVNPLNGLIPVQTSGNTDAGPSTGAVPVASRQTQGQAQVQGQGQVHNADIAGVLKRNQACLQCRRRKLVSTRHTPGSCSSAFCKGWYH